MTAGIDLHLGYALMVVLGFALHHLRQPVDHDIEEAADQQPHAGGQRRCCGIAAA